MALYNEQTAVKGRSSTYLEGAIPKIIALDCIHGIDIDQHVSQINVLQCTMVNYYYISLFTQNMA